MLVVNPRVNILIGVYQSFWLSPNARSLTHPAYGTLVSKKKGSNDITMLTNILINLQTILLSNHYLF